MPESIWVLLKIEIPAAKILCRSQIMKVKLKSTGVVGFIHAR